MLTWKKILMCLGVMVTLLACGDMVEASEVYRIGVEEKPLVFLPFKKGEVVRIPQGNNGTFTHNGRYAYAYDFDMGETQNNSSNKVFGVDVLSPVNGVIVYAVHDKKDFTCMGSTCNSGWGNSLVIKPDGVDYYMRLNHLKYNSIPNRFRVGKFAGVSGGVRVKQGEKVGEVGSNGISTHPHLDMSLVTDYNTREYETVEFDFVEGPAEQYAWLYSELELDKAVLDNSGRANLGAEVEVVGIYTNTQNWRAYVIPETYTSYGYDYYSVHYLASNIHGTNFYYIYDSGGWFAWKIKHLDSGNNWMAVEVNCYEDADLMSEKVYYLWSKPGGNRSNFLPQTDGINYVGFYDEVAYDDYFGQTESVFYMQNHSTTGKAMCVDSLVLYKNPS
jgi:hypothetical protein